MHCWCSTSFTGRMLLTWSLSVYDGIVGTKCCSIISCLDRQWKLRHFYNGDMPSNNKTQNQPKNSCKPADFGQTHRRILLWTPISQASKIFWVRIQTLNIMVSLRLSIYLSKINFKHFDYNEFSDFCQVERSQDVSRTLYLMAKRQGDPYLTTWKSTPDSAVSPQFPCVQDVGFWLGLGRIKLSTHTQREDKF